MPFSKKFMKSMGIPNIGDQFNGFTIESVWVEHVHIKGSSPRRYEYPTEIIVNGKGSLKDVERALLMVFNQKDVQLLSGYGNPYRCNIGKISVSQLNETKYSVKARGSCVRVHKSEKIKNVPSDDKNLEQLSLSVYEAFFKNAGAVEVDRTFYPVNRTSRADVKYVKIDGYSFIEQNPEKSSRWGEKAREGHKIVWVTKGRRYVARVMDGKFLTLGKKKRT